MTSHHEHTPSPDDEFEYLGEAMTPDIIDLRPPVPQRTLGTLFSERPSLSSVGAMKEFTQAIDLHERHGHMKVVDDVIGLRRMVDGQIETYRDKLTRAERAGRQESARFGVGTIMGERVVAYLLDWDYFAGSLGEVAGEKFVRAAELAEREKLPFISMGASSGVRQHENVLGLVQMQRMATAVNKFQATTGQPYISVMAGQVWGGMSASAVPIADMVVALEGTDYGFAGPRVIETFEGRPVERGMQSAEANMVDRNIDVVVKGVPELLEFLGRSLRTVRQSRRAGSLLGQVHDNYPQMTGRPMRFGQEGLSAALWHRQDATSTVYIPRDRRDMTVDNESDKLMARYREIAAGAGRLDSEFLMQTVFDSATPLYNSIQLGEDKKYPNVIASLATIGEQGFMVIGDQPSYTHSKNYVGKHAANPGPEDFEYASRMLEAAERWKLPVVFLTDTLGALPTMAAERRGQSRAIAELIQRAGSYPYPTVSVISGGLGSGGGLATTPFGRETIMLDSALGFVSEPRSMASILYNTANPTNEQVAETLLSSRSSADDLKAQGLVDTIVTDSDNPFETAHSIRAAIISGYERQRTLTPRRLRAMGAARLTPKMIGKHSAEH